MKGRPASLFPRRACLSWAIACVFYQYVGAVAERQNALWALHFLASLFSVFAPFSFPPFPPCFFPSLLLSFL